MSFVFNIQLDRANCHIRANRNHLIPEETINDRPHKHYSMEFHCIFSGEEIITLPLENRQLKLTSGNILLLPQEIYHGVITKNATVNRLCFNFSAEPSGTERSSIVDLFLNIREPVVFDIDKTSALLETCYYLCQNKNEPLHELRQGMHFINMALNLMSNVLRVQDVAPVPSHHTMRQRWQIEDYINQHYTDNSGIKGLADTLYLSQRQTSALVKRYFGKDYKSLIIRRRMELAEIYLQDASKQLSEIAYDVGYHSYSGFELCFKRYFGITPQEKRASLQERTL